MYEICLHCHLLTFSWFRMNYGQFVIHVLTLSPIIDILHVNSKRMKIFLDYFHFLHENYLILNPAGENFWTQLALLHINSSYFHKKRKERDSREETTYYKQRNCIIMREIKGNCCCFCWDFNAEVRPCCTWCIISFSKIYLSLFLSISI